MQLKSWSSIEVIRFVCPTTYENLLQLFRYTCVYQSVTRVLSLSFRNFDKKKKRFQNNLVCNTSLLYLFIRGFFLISTQRSSYTDQTFTYAVMSAQYVHKNIYPLCMYVRCQFFCKADGDGLENKTKIQNETNKKNRYFIRYS